MRNDLMIRWMFGAGFALGLVGLSGCATGSDSLGSLEAALGLPSVTASVAAGDGSTVLDALPGGPLPSSQPEGSSQAPPSFDRQPPVPPVLAQTDGASHLGPQETGPASSDVPAAPLQLSQAGYQKDLEAEKEAEQQAAKEAEKESYDPFAKAEGSANGMEEYDPWEPLNAKTFVFNRKLDEWIVKPVATVYDKILPDGAEHGLSNIFHNMRTVPRLMNNLFQGKFKGAGIEFGRFLLNTSFGLGGYFDFAKEAYGIETPDEDFGQTLAAYGTKPGPYLVIPILGSYTVRDISGFVVDLAMDPFNLLLFPFVDVKSWPQVVTNDDTILFSQISIRAGYMVNERSINIETTFEGVEETVVDLYGAVRNAYLQKRAKAIRE